METRSHHGEDITGSGIHHEPPTESFVPQPTPQGLDEDRGSTGQAHSDTSTDAGERASASRDFSAEWGFEVGTEVGEPKESGTDETTIPDDDRRRSGASVLPHIRQLGEYDLIKEIGRGGMGIVYMARQRGLNRIVALKVIRAGVWASEEQIRRFRVEAEAAALLHHPNIVDVYAIGEQDGHHYFSMQYVDGESLAVRLAEGPLSPNEAARCAIEIAKAVQHAHEHGILHRDLKPSNVLVDRDGHVRVSDFGLAKRLDEDSDLTRSGELLGTPAYMSPEQASGRADAVTQASDVYSLGALLYALLTARPPFHAETPHDVVFKIRSSNPDSPRSVVGAVPRDLEAICLKCLEKRPADRYQSAEELAEDLGRYLRGEPIRARRVGRVGRFWRWCRRKPLVASLTAATVLSLLTAAGVALDAKYRRGNDTSAEELMRAELRKRSRLFVSKADLAATSNLRESLAWLAAALRTDQGSSRREPISRTRLTATLRLLPRLETFTILPYPVYLTHPAPDGVHTILRYTGGQTPPAIWDGRSGATTALQLPPGVDARPAAWSPDARHLAVRLSDSRISVHQVESGAPVGPPLEPALNEGETPSRIGFTGDGSLLVAVGHKGTLRMWRMPGLEPVPETVSLPVSNPGIEFPAESASVIVVARDGIEWRELPSGRLLRRWPVEFSGTPRSISVSADGSRLAVIDGAGRVTIVALASTGIQAQFGPGIKRAVLDAVGWKIALVDAENRISVHRPDVHEQKPTAVWNVGEDVLSLEFAPDGQALLVVTESEKAAVWDLQTGLRTALVLPEQSGTLRRPAFFGSGSRRVLTVGRKSAAAWDLSVLEPLRMLDHDPRFRIHSVVPLPDGEHFLAASTDYTATINRFSDLRAVVRMTAHENNVHSADVSADGTLAATGDGNGVAYVWETATGQPITPPLQHEDKHALFFLDLSPDATRLAVWDHLSGLLYVWNVNTGRLLYPPLREDREIRHAEFHPDGRTLLTLWGNQVALRDVETGLPVMRFTRPEDILGACYSPDGTRVLAWNFLHFWVWDAESGDMLLPPISTAHTLHKAFWSPDGQYIITAAVLGELPSDLWRADTGAHVAALPHQGPVLRVGFGPDGNLMATTTQGYTSRLWDLQTGEAIAPPLYQPAQTVPWVLFGQNGRKVISISKLGTVRSLDLSSPPVSDATLIDLAELIAGRHVDDGGRMFKLDRNQLQARWKQLVAAKPDRYFVHSAKER